MDEPADRRLTRRAANDTDVPFLLRLRHQTMDEHIVASGTSVSEDEHLRRVLFRFECAQILLLEGEACGLLKVARDGKHWHLMQIQLAPEAQGQGIGTSLIRQLVSEARHAGAALELDVLKANPARRLYERLGFVIVAEGPHSFDMRLEQGTVAERRRPKAL